MQNQMEPSFSVLVMSIASNAQVCLGNAPDPQTEKKNVDLPMAKFNIDLLMMLQKKSKGNLTQEETQLIDFVIHDLQNHYLKTK
jgi:hypothetical protein